MSIGATVVGQIAGEIATARVRRAGRALATCVALIGGLALPPAIRAATEFLDPQVAFKLTARALDDRRIELHFDVAKGYHLYRERFAVRAEPASQGLGELQSPPGKKEFDTAFQKELEVYREPVTLVLPLPAAPTAAFRLTVVDQGCADQGLCYPPTEREFDITPAAGAGGLLGVRAVLAATPGFAGGGAAAQGGAGMSMPGGGNAGGSLLGGAAAVAGATTPGSTAAGAATATPTDSFGQALHSRNWWTVAGVFALAGLLLSFTPCVLPMLPILSAIIVGQHGGQPGNGQGNTQGNTPAPVSRSKGFALALSYSLGMALVYTALGMAAGWMGQGLAAALQNAWVLGAFGLLLVALSLSMFGVYELQLPASLQTRLTAASSRQAGGQWLGVFVMGGLSALIVGPCVAAPLAGALVYISQTRDIWLGGAALFCLAAGMSVPLLLLGASAGTWLPRAGAWMERVKHVFGVMLLAVALWLVAPVLPTWAVMAASAWLMLACAVGLGAFSTGTPGGSPGRVAARAVGLLLAAGALMQLVGAASGGRDLLQPLRHLAGGVTRTAGAGAHELPFVPTADLAALRSAVAASAKPVMVDLYADWCVACKEFEAFTLSDEAVRQRLAGYTLLRVDVTANSASDQALLKHFGLFGPPTLLFFAPGAGGSGQELPQARVIGFMNARDFLAHLDSVGRS